MTVLKWFVILAIVGYLGGRAVLFFKQREFIFPIPQTVRTAPEAAGFPEAEEHVLSTADGEKVIIWHVPAQPGHAVVIYFPGNGDFLAGNVGRFRAIAADGTGLVALSYRGYAGSSGQPSEQGLLQDAAAAYAFTAARYPPDRIVLWGFSLGTGAAVAVAAEQPVGKLILEAPYTSMADVAAWHFPVLPVRWLLRDRSHLHALGSRAWVRGGLADHSVRHRIRGRAPCRGDRRADRRALRHAVVDAGGHHHRSRADRDHHAR